MRPDRLLLFAGGLGNNSYRELTFSGHLPCDRVCAPGRLHEVGLKAFYNNAMGEHSNC